VSVPTRLRGNASSVRSQINAQNRSYAPAPAEVLVYLDLVLGPLEQVDENGPGNCTCDQGGGDQHRVELRTFRNAARHNGGDCGSKCQQKEKLDQFITLAETPKSVMIFTCALT